MPHEIRHKEQAKKNYTLLFLVLAFIVMLFFVTMVKMKIGA